MVHLYFLCYVHSVLKLQRLHLLDRILNFLSVQAKFSSQIVLESTYGQQMHFLLRCSPLPLVQNTFLLLSPCPQSPLLSCQLVVPVMWSTRWANQKIVVASRWCTVPTKRAPPLSKENQTAYLAPCYHRRRWMVAVDSSCQILLHYRAFPVHL